MAALKSKASRARKGAVRKPQKPKVFEIDGHLLSEAMYATFQNNLAVRGAQGTVRGPLETRRVALEDTIYRKMPSTQIKRRIHDAYKAARDASLAINAMQQYAFYGDVSTVIRDAGCELLKKLALDLYYTSAKLTLAVGNVETEGGTRLQDWLAQEARIDEIGAAREPVTQQEVPHV